MDLVTIKTAKMIGSMRSGLPMPHLVIPRVTTQADSVGDLGGTLLEADDLGDVAAAVHVQAALAVAILALYALLLVVSVLEALAGVVVTSSADLRPDARSAGDLSVLGQRLLTLGANGPGRWAGDDQTCTKYDSQEKSMNADRHSDSPGQRAR